MAASVESPFLKKFEGKITVVNRDGHTGGERNDSTKSRRRDSKIQSGNSNTQSPSTPLSPHMSSGNGGTIQVNRGFSESSPDNSNTLPPRQHPLIFGDNNEPSIEHLRKISAENKYRVFSEHSYSPYPNPSNPSFPNPQYSSPYPPANAHYPPQPTNAHYPSQPINGFAQYAPNPPYSNMPPPYQSQTTNNTYSTNFPTSNSNQSYNTKSPVAPRTTQATVSAKSNNANVSSPPHSGRSRHNSQPEITMPPTNMGPINPYMNQQYQQTPIFPSNYPPNPYDNNAPQMYYQPPMNAQYPYHAPSNPPSSHAQDASYSPPSYPHQQHSISSPNASSANTSASSPSSSNPSTKEQLYFSKQPREVYFKPHNLNDYRRLKGELTSLKMGNLGPDLQSAEYLAKKEQKDKMKEYAKNVRTMHNTSGLPTGPGKLPDPSASASPVEEKRVAKEKRNKAKEYPFHQYNKVKVDDM